MSCYEWEEGTIKLPSKDYSKIRREFIDRLNFLKESEMKSAILLRDAILLEGKGKRKFRYMDSAWNRMEKYGVSDSIIYGMFPHTTGFTGFEKPKAITKKLMNFAKTNDTSFDFSEGGVYFNNKNKTVTWVVHENNHACEFARKSIYGKALFHTLARVKWTSRSGGTIVGNNEYNRDDHNAGGGGNYVVEEFSKAESERAAKNSRYGACFGYSYRY